MFSAFLAELLYYFTDEVKDDALQEIRPNAICLLSLLTEGNQEVTQPKNNYKEKTLTQGLGGGLAVSVLAFYSDDPNWNPADSLI